jgi:hypothetical protein
LGEQLDLALQGRGPENDRRLVRPAQRGLGLLAVGPAGQECFGLPETGVGGLEGIAQPLPGHRGRPPPLRVEPPFQPGLLGPGQEQATGRRRNAGLGRWRVAPSVQRGDDGCGPLVGVGNAVGPSSGGRQLGPVGLQPQRSRIAQARQLRGDALGSCSAIQPRPSATAVAA